MQKHLISTSMVADLFRSTIIDALLGNNDPRYEVVARYGSS